MKEDRIQLGKAFPVEMQSKLDRARDFMQAQKLDALLLTRRDNFAWLTAGGDNHCASNTELGVASILITEDGQYIITSNIESHRIEDEELGHKAEDEELGRREQMGQTGFEFIVYSWHEGPEETINRLLREKVARGRTCGKTPYGKTASRRGVAPGGEEASNGKVGADFYFPGTKMVYPDIVTLRYPFTPWEAARYRAFGPLVADIVERACFEITPGMTEFAIAGKITSALLSEGFTPTVVLVGTDERITKYRHPIPTCKPLDKHCMVVVCAQKGGLTVALTRIIYFGSLPGDLRDKHDVVTRVDARLIASSRVGMRFCDVFMEGVRAYEELGYPDEWNNHHQGGPIGYQDREFLATPKTEVAILPNQAISWNPSVPETKSEDTILVSEDEVEMITRGRTGWPMVKVEVGGQAIFRPDILCL